MNDGAARTGMVRSRSWPRLPIRHCPTRPQSCSATASPLSPAHPPATNCAPGVWAPAGTPSSASRLRVRDRPFRRLSRPERGSRPAPSRRRLRSGRQRTDALTTTTTRPSFPSQMRITDYRIAVASSDGPEVWILRIYVLLYVRWSSRNPGSMPRWSGESAHSSKPRHRPRKYAQHQTLVPADGGCWTDWPRTPGRGSSRTE